MKRDPRIEPKVGDRLRDGNIHVAVTSVDRAIHYTLVQHRSTGINATPMVCDMTKKSWRWWAKDAEVIHAAD